MKIEGTLLRIFPTKNIKTYKITDFILKQADGNEVKVTSFGPVPVDLLGSVVAVSATPDKLGKPVVDRNTSITPLEGGGVATATEEAPVAEAKPKAVRKTTTAKAVETVPADSGREGYRGEAKLSVTENLRSAVEIAKDLGLDYTLSDLVALGDMIGRTQTAIFMDAKKDTRTASFARR